MSASMEDTEEHRIAIVPWRTARIVHDQDGIEMQRDGHEMVAGTAGMAVLAMIFEGQAIKVCCATQVVGDGCARLPLATSR